ncbi:HEAT repeat domain-containing protein [Haloplanus halophilus]|uniref:HEAT repeat domain-containing protein n=1 Tax=Haloplanus halophilus TaxID=2949993 RepID=UPI00203E0F2A|nr:HEAT repeat domain-containing protein [Haloplanus sp. GDY1]
MTDGDDETDLPAETLDSRLDAAAEDLDAAETEADLDDVEETLDGIAEDLDAADLPTPDEDEEDAEDPREELDARLDDLRDELAAARGPYASDVVDDVEAARDTLTDTEWTEDGEDEAAAAVAAFVDEVATILDADLSGDDAEALDAAAEAVADADLDADADAETIDDLLSATDDLAAGLDDAEEWDDLETHEQLRAQGFYDVLGHYKDFPPEWAALKEWEQRGNVEMVLLALDSFQSEFMERHCLEAITRMNDEAAFDAMHGRAGKRDKPGIKALGKMGAEDAVDTLLEYVDADSDPGLQKVTFKALGEIGSEAATGPLANKLAAENEQVRPYAARALGLIGDTRAVDPLADTLADDENDEVRAAAAWALRQIGTERALSAAADYADDRAYLVQHEASQAADALAVEGTA